MYNYITDRAWFNSKLNFAKTEKNNVLKRTIPNGTITLIFKPKHVHITIVNNTGRISITTTNRVLAYNLVSDVIIIEQQKI